jgi:hypothetical protein
MNLDKSKLPDIAREAVKSGNLASIPASATEKDLLAICQKTF